MLTGQIHGKLRDSAPFAVRKPENVLLSGCGMTAGVFARATTTNVRGPTKGPYLNVASRISRAAARGRIRHTFTQEYHS
ncbi:MAG TPA: hypothetical protein VEB68_10895 [Croceibacterium sp.]|nr:hypothetical protein [Croceibacterium sp.]